MGSATLKCSGANATVKCSGATLAATINGKNYWKSLNIYCSAIGIYSMIIKHLQNISMQLYCN